MRYDESLAIGTAAEGVIKCTWAAIYDANERKLFSLQNRNFSRETIVPERKMWNGTDPGELLSGGTYALNLAWTTERLFEPVVIARNYRYAYKVPVELLPSARSAIVEILLRKAAWWDAKKDKETNTELKDRWEKEVKRLEEAISYFQNLRTVYVKPKAFDWHPLNTFALNGEDVEAAKKAYENSKKILAVSAATIIL